MITHEDLIRYLTDDGYVFTYDESIEKEITDYENALREEGKRLALEEVYKMARSDEYDAWDILSWCKKQLKGEHTSTITFPKFMNVDTTMKEINQAFNEMNE